MRFFLLLVFASRAFAQLPYPTINTSDGATFRGRVNSNFGWLYTNKAGVSACGSNQYAIQTTTAGVVCASLTNLQITTALGFTPANDASVEKTSNKGQNGGYVGIGSTGTVTVGTVATVTGLACDGSTDDRAKIQAALDSGATHIVIAKAGTCLISTGLMIYSNQWLDLSPSTTIKLQNGATTNIIANHAATVAQRTVTDAAITSGAATLTSATAAFTSADVGRSVIIADADTGGSGFPLCVTITAVTNSTTATVSANAGATVSGKTATFYDRDSNIMVTGGTWDNGSPTGTGTQLHGLFFRRVDGLEIGRITAKSAGLAKYLIAPGDVTGLNIHDVKCASISACVQANGPINGARLDNLSGTSSDDFIAWTAVDWIAYRDVQGPMTNVVINNIRPNNPTNNILLLGGTSTSSLTHFRITNVFASGTGTPRGINLDNQSLTGGTSVIDDIVIENVYPLPGNVGVRLAAVSGGNVTVRNLTQTLTGTSPISISVEGTGATWNTITVDRAVVTSASGTNGSLFNTASGTTVGTVTVLNSSGSFTGTATGALLSAGGTVTSYAVHNTRASFAGGTSHFFAVPTGGSVSQVAITNSNATYTAGTTGYGVYILGTLSNLHVADILFSCGDKNPYFINLASGTLGYYAVTNLTQVAGHDFAIFGSGTTVGKGSLSNSSITGVFRIADVFTTVDMALNNVTVNASLEMYSVGTGGVLTVRGAGLADLGGNGGLLRSASQVIHVINQDFPVNVTLLTNGNGDRANNTTGGSCGTGPIISNGTAFKNLYTGTGC